MEAKIKAHYYIENICLDKIHPKNGGVLVPRKDANGHKDMSQLIECKGRASVDILEKYVIDGELAFTKVRFVGVFSGQGEGWTWGDLVNIKFEEHTMDGRFNQVFKEEVKVERVESED